MRRHSLNSLPIKDINIKNGLVISIQDDKLFWEVVGLDLNLALVLIERVKYEILKRLDGQDINSDRSAK